MRKQHPLRRGRASIPHVAYLLTAVTAQRARHFADFRSACIAARALHAALASADCEALAWVLMPDHLHLLVQLGRQETVSQLMQRVKGRISFDYRRHVGVVEVWQSQFHDHALRTSESVAEAARYLVANPIRAGLVEQAGDYPFWDCVWLEEALAEPAGPMRGRGRG